MKRNEFKNCAGCNRGVMAGGIIFYRVQVEMFGIDVRAVERQHGLEMMIGNPAIAQMMGPDADLAKPIAPDSPSVMLICAECMTGQLGMLCAYMESQ